METAVIALSVATLGLAVAVVVLAFKLVSSAGAGGEATALRDRLAKQVADLKRVVDSTHFPL